MSPHIAAIVNLHREGAKAIPTLASAWRAVHAARGKGLDTVLVLTLDRPDTSTAEIAQHWKMARDAEVNTIEVGDLGAARNAAADAGDSTWLAFLDGDDLWGEQWLWRAHEAGTAETPGDASQLNVWHPAVNVIFGDHHSLLHHVDSEDPSFSWSRFRLHNQWTALSFVRRTDLLDIPYPRNDLAAGFGFEDWSWNEEVLRRGGRHRVVPDTCHFIHRSTQPSLLGRSQRALRTRYPAVEEVSHERRPVPTEADPNREVSSATHVTSEVRSSQAVLEQIQLASMIEPRVLETLDASGRPASLPQNWQTHTTPSQVALELVEIAASQMTSHATVAEILGSVRQLAELDVADRCRVVAEVLLDPEMNDRARGNSELITEAIDYFPQLRRAVKSSS